MIQGTIVLLVMLFIGFTVHANARPQSRFDESTGTLRRIGDGPLEWESSAWGQGGKTFKSLCQSCHQVGNDKGASVLWRESKSSKGWNRVFAQRYPQCAKDGSWDSMTLDQQLMVNDHLYRFARNTLDTTDSC